MIQEDRPVFILAGNGPYENRGCEAIVRGTTNIIREYFKEPQFICLSFFQSNEQYKKQCATETDSAILHLSTKMLTRKTVLSNFWKKETWNSLLNYYFKQDKFYHGIYQEMFPYLPRSECVLSVGGDNYSLDYGVPTLFTKLDDVVMDNRVPLYIWGASIGPFSSNPYYEKQMCKHLKKIDGIFTRETLSANYLKTIGITDNVHPTADPAFVMEARKPKHFDDSIGVEDGGIGLNFSPLMAKYVTGGDIDAWVKHASKITEKISQITEIPIFLIPHVNSIHDNDYNFLKKVDNNIQNRKSEISLIPPIYDASEIKWIIKNMTIFAGARTHATIASLSSSIPTISFSYSLKAQGINYDIFGHTKYCVNSKNISLDTILPLVDELLTEKGVLSNNLHQKVKKIREISMQSGKNLKQLLDEKNLCSFNL